MGLKRQNSTNHEEILLSVASLPIQKLLRFSMERLIQEITLKEKENRISACDNFKPQL
jgi:hypothetical protein